MWHAHYCGVHNICIPSGSFAEGGGGMTNRGDTAMQSVLGKKNLIYSLPQRSTRRPGSKHLSDKSALGRWQSTYQLHLLPAGLPVKWLNCATVEIDRTHSRAVQVQVLLKFKPFKYLKWWHIIWMDTGMSQALGGVPNQEFKREV